MADGGRGPENDPWKHFNGHLTNGNPLQCPSTDLTVFEGDEATEERCRRHFLHRLGIGMILGDAHQESSVVLELRRCGGVAVWRCGVCKL